MKKINIGYLLRDTKPGTILYSPICGECTFDGLERVPDSKKYWINVSGSHKLRFNFDGSYDLNGECLLFPSKDIRDWGVFQTKFARGNKDFAKELQSVFTSHGCVDLNDNSCSFENNLYYIDRNSNSLMALSVHDNASLVQYITTTGIELKPNQKVIKKFQAFDPVLVRDKDTEMWIPRIFSDYEAEGSYPYQCQDGCGYKQCIPYNKSIIKLLGINKEYEN